MTYEEKIKLIDDTYDKLEMREKAKPIIFNTEMVKAILSGRKTQTRRFANISTINPCHKEHKEHKFIRDDFAGDPYTGYVCKYCGWGVAHPHNGRFPVGTSMFRPMYNEGDILYVRETWNDCNVASPERYVYKADYKLDIEPYCNWSWKPSIHMPKSAARIFLKVTAVRLERLQDITEQDAEREGICRMFDHLTDAEYEAWANGRSPAHRISKKKNEWGWNNYLWHGHYGTYGQGNKTSDAWEYQMSGYDSARDSFSSLWNSLLPLKQWDIIGWDNNPWVWVYEFERVEAGR